MTNDQILTEILINKKNINSLKSRNKELHKLLSESNNQEIIEMLKVLKFDIHPIINNQFILITHEHQESKLFKYFEEEEEWSNDENVYHFLNDKITLHLDYFNLEIRINFDFDFDSLEYIKEWNLNINVSNLEKMIIDKHNEFDEFNNKIKKIIKILKVIEII